MATIKKEGNQFPFVPPLYFVQNIGTEAWALVRIYMALVAISTLVLFFNWSYPFYWIDNIQAIADPTLLPITIQKIDFLGYQIPVYAEALQSWVTFIGQPILPSETLVWVWVLFSIVGWAGLLAASSRFQSFYFYAVWALFAIWVYFTDASIAIVGTDPYRIVSFGFILAFLTPAYYLKNLPAPPSIIRLTLFFCLLLSFFWMLIYYQGGFPSVFLASAKPFPVFYILTLIGMLFWAKETIHLLLLYVTNHRKTEDRKPLGWFVVVNILIALLSGIYAASAAKYIEWQIPISPILFLGISILISVVTSQAIYGYIKHQIQSNTAFILALLSIGILILHFLSFIGASGEMIFIRQIERYWAFVWFLANIGQFFYLYGNFASYLKERVNFYYLIYDAEQFGYWAIPIISAGILFLWESNTRWVSIRYLSSIYGNIRGDYYFLKNDKTEAFDYYSEAVYFTQGNFKSSFNYACLLSEKPEKQLDAINFFKQVELVENFPPARLNASMLYLTRQKNELAIQALLNTPQPNFTIYNNLGILFYQKGIKDSAFKYLDLAWRNHPSSEIAVNLCRFYDTFNQKDSVLFFLNESKKRSFSLAAIDAALFYNLAYDTLVVNPPHHADNHALTLVYNNLMNHWKQKKYTEADQMANFLYDEKTEKPSILQAKMMTQWGLDSIENAISRTIYLSGMHPEYRIQANRMLGALLWEKRCPELASVYFKEAGIFGSMQDSMLYCLSAATVGLYEEAQLGLERFVSNHAISLDTIAPALKILNQLQKGEIEESFSHVREAQMAIAFCGNLHPMSAKKIWAQFKNDPLIQLYAAEIAIETQDIAWQKEIFPTLEDKPMFNRVKAWMADSKTHISSTNPAFKLWEARMFAAEKKYTEAIASLKIYLKYSPLDAVAAIYLADLYLLSHNSTAAILSFGDYLRLNDRNRYFMSKALAISEKLGNESEVTIYASRLLPLLSSKAEKAELIKKYPQVEEKQMDSVVQITNH